jgi:CubicO group peptidase (beta-lactamase class C family)
MPEPLDSALPRTANLIRRGIDARLHRGVVVYASLAGRIVVDGAIGEAAEGVPLTADAILPWLSAGKPLTAVAVLQQVERGRMALDDRVALYIPEFAVNGKEQVTIRELLIHTAGIQPVAAGWPEQPWEAIIDRICRARLRHGWTAGQAAYDPARSWFLLGEVLRRIDGRPVDRIVREEVCEPLGLRDTWMSLTPEQEQSHGDRLATLYLSTDGELRGPDPRAAVSPVPAPGSSLRGTARDLGGFYEMLLQRGTRHGARVLAASTVDLMTQRHRERLLDTTFQHVIDFGLGVIVDSNRYGPDTVPYGFGRSSSPQAFGHGGSQSSIGFADPGHGLAAVLIANGCPGEAAHNERHRELATALYEDLGLA